MKKLMFAAAAIVAGSLFADVESANIVGFTGKDTAQDNNFVAAPFFAPGYNTVDIQSIKIDDGAGGASIGYMQEFFEVWEGTPEVVEGSSFVYLQSFFDPDGLATECYWGDQNDENRKVEYSFEIHQGVVINCAEGLKLVSAGQVPTGEVSFVTIEANNFVANPFPAAIDIQSIKIDDGAGGASIGYMQEFFEVWEGTPEVVEGSSFVYLQSFFDPDGLATECYWGDQNDENRKVEYSIPAEQGFVINCAEGLDVTITPPYSL